MKDILNRHLVTKYPSLDREKLDTLISENLLSPYQVQVPKSILQQAQQFISAIYKLREDPSYKNFLQPEISTRKLIDPGNKAICMSYDFHVDESGTLKLIEINTNAAFLALGFEFYQSQGLALPVSEFNLNQLKACIETEMQLFGKKTASPQISIIDDKPWQQRLYAEFLLFEALFKSWGWNVTIEDFPHTSDVDFIYNRHIDFFLEEESAKALREKFLSKQACFSPNPFEYLMLADKQRLIDLWDEKFWQQMSPAAQTLKTSIQKHLPQAFSVEKDNLEQAWNSRKNVFFKPKRAYGSKQSYKGAKISHKVLEEIAQGDFIAQEYIAAPELEFSANENSKKLLGSDLPQKFKYDLRFYTYQDQLQMVLARLYQGQATNAKTLGGGFAPVIFF